MAMLTRMTIDYFNTVKTTSKVYSNIAMTKVDLNTDISTHEDVIFGAGRVILKENSVAKNSLLTTSKE